MDEKSLLAQNYVPQSLQRINEFHAAQVVACPPLSDITAKLGVIRNSLVPPVTDKEFEPEMFRICPNATIPSDLYYAVEERVKHKFGQKNSSKQQQKPFPLVDNIGNLKDYCKTFGRLLKEERNETLLLYERYSQYNVYVKVDQAGAVYRGMPVPKSNRYLHCSVQIEGISDAKPTLQPGDSLLVRTLQMIEMPSKLVGVGLPHYGYVEILSQVTSIQRRMGGVIYATWLDTYRDKLLKMNYTSSCYTLRFIPSLKKYQHCATALNWLALQDSHCVMPILFPTSAPILPLSSPPPTTTKTKDNGGDNHNNNNNNAEEEEEEECYNVDQREFIRIVLKRTQHPAYDTVRGPMILTGPAGTGKTKTMLAAILQLLKQKKDTRILVCAPSHTAADVITERLSEHLSNHQLFRLLDSDRPIETVPVSILKWCRQSEETGSFTLPMARVEWNALRVIVCTCVDTYLLYAAGLTNHQLRARRQGFAKFMERSCKLCNLEIKIGGVDDPHFTHLFVDEAAQATEPETLIPLSVVVDPQPGSRKVEIALVGDPRQLSPSVYSTQAANAGLGRSWMERLLMRPVSALGGGRDHMLGPEMVSMDDWIERSFRENLSVFLTLNYRGHPSFLMMPSALFYFDKLHSSYNGSHYYWCKVLRNVEKRSQMVEAPIALCQQPPEAQQRKQYDWPIHFRGVVGQDASVTINSGYSSNSWCNQKEADVVVDIVLTLMRKGVSTQLIGVMSPFRGQVVLIRNLLRRQNLGGVNVGTIEDYQAVERDVIVLSLTRSNWAFVENDISRRMGVFGQPKRSNVALTRAEHLFIVVGNPQIMAKDFVWRQFLLFCLRNGLFYGESCDEWVLKWTPSSHLIRYRQEGNESNFVKESKKEDDDEEDVVVVGSMERLVQNRRSDENGIHETTAAVEKMIVAA